MIGANILISNIHISIKALCVLPVGVSFFDRLSVCARFAGGVRANGHSEARFCGNCRRERASAARCLCAPTSGAGVFAVGLAAAVVVVKRSAQRITA